MNKENLKGIIIMAIVMSVYAILQDTIQYGYFDIDYIRTVILSVEIYAAITVLVMKAGKAIRNMIKNWKVNRVTKEERA